MRIRFSAFSFAVVFFAQCALSQSILSSITGVVRDSTGAVLPGAEVEIRGSANGFSRTTSTNIAGEYGFLTVPNGAYSVTVSLPGFRSATARDVTLHVDETRRLEFVLEVGPIQENVQVVADAVALEMDEAARGQVIHPVRVEGLPLNGREFIQLGFTAVGTTPPAEGSNLSTARYGALNVNGARETDNRFVIDGIENTALFNGQVALSPSIDTIEEFKIVTGNYPAEFGGAAGGFVTVVTKSGTGFFTKAFLNSKEMRLSMRRIISTIRAGRYRPFSGINLVQHLEDPFR